MKAFPESNLPEAVKTRLADYGKSIPAAKILLIRRQREFNEPGISFFVAAVAQEKPALHEFQLSSYAELLSLDVPAILAGDSAYEAHLRTEPLILVCANGRRDACCARNGIPAFNALRNTTRQSSSPLVWQSSHVGGHRFAANVLCLPHGLLYGRVNAGSATNILEVCRRGEIYLPNLRGRTCYTRIEQAAEYYLRRQNGDTSLSAFRLLETDELASGRWLVSFSTTKTGEVHHLELKIEETGRQVFSGCQLDKSTSVTNFQLESHTVSNTPKQA